MIITTIVDSNFPCVILPLLIICVFHWVVRCSFIIISQSHQCLLRGNKVPENSLPVTKLKLTVHVLTFIVKDFGGFGFVNGREAASASSDAIINTKIFSQ